MTFEASEKSSRGKLATSRHRILLVLLLVVASVALGLPTARAATISGPFLISTITNGVGNAGLEFPPQQRAFFDVGDHWVFYVGPVGSGSCAGGSTCLFYACSATGSAWTITETAFLMDTREYSIFDKSGTVYLAAYNTTQHTLNQVLYFVKGTLNSAACTISFGAAQTIKSASTTEAWDYPSVTVDSNNQAYVAYDQNDGVLTSFTTSGGGALFSNNGPYPANGGEWGNCFTYTGADDSVSQVKFTFTASGGSPSGTAEVLIFATTGSPCIPSGSPLATSTAITPTQNVVNTFTFASPLALTSGTTYAIDIRLVTCGNCAGGTYFALSEGGNSGHLVWTGSSYSSFATGFTMDYEVDTQNTGGTVRAIRSAGTDYTTWTGDSSLNSTRRTHWRPSIVPLTGGKVYAAYVTSTQSGVWGNVYNSGWQAAERAEIPAQDQASNEVFLFNDGKSDLLYSFWESVDVTLRAQTRTAAGVWQHNDNSTFEHISSPIFDSFAASYDATQDLFYVYNYDVPNNRITQTTGTFAKGWSSTTTFLTTTPLSGSTTADNLAVEPTANVTSGQGSFGVVFTSTTISSTSTSLYFALVSYPEAAPGCGSCNPPLSGGQQPNNFAFNSSTLFNLITVPYQLTTTQALLLLVLFPAAVISISADTEQRQGLRGRLMKQLKSRAPLLSYSLLTASLTLIFDYVFHLTQTSPMEVPVYFAMKFLSAFPIAYFLVPRIGRILSAAVFTIWVDVYYGLFVVLLGVSWLSSSPNQVIQIDGIMSQLFLLPLWTLAHGLFFLVAAELAIRSAKPLRAKRTNLRISLV